MPNILLISAPYSQSYGKMTPPVQLHLGLAYLAAAIEESGNNVRVVDMVAEGFSTGDLIKVLNEKHYDVAGFTVTTPTVSSSLRLAQEIKKHSPKTLIVFGGIHPTIKPRETIKNESVDVIVKGEGEITFKEIIEALKHSRDFSKVKGILYKENNTIKETSSRELLKDLDVLPFPARHLFKTKRYTYPDALYKETAPIFTSRGCPGRCTYCNTFQVFTRAFRARSAKNVVDEIEFLVKKMGIKEIHIWDDNFTTIKKRVFEIRDEILTRKLKVKFAFPNGIRADFLSEEILKALKDMGVYSISVGVESGSQEILDKAHKGVKLEKIEEIFILAKKLKIETWAFFILGLPGENIETIKKTIRFAKKINPDIAKFHILKPFPGTEVYDYLCSKDYILTKDYDQFGIHTPPVHRLESLTPADILKWQKVAYKAFYLRPMKLLSQMLRIRTFNRLVLNVQAATNLTKLVFLKD